MQRIAKADQKPAFGSGGETLNAEAAWRLSSECCCHFEPEGRKARIRDKIVEQFAVAGADRHERHLPILADQLGHKEAQTLLFALAIAVAAMRGDPIDPLTDPGGTLDVRL